MEAVIEGLRENSAKRLDYKTLMIGLSKNDVPDYTDRIGRFRLAVLQIIEDFIRDELYHFNI